MSQQETEQITAMPKEEKPVKIKDAKKVAAGKALAERNKKAREAQKRLEQMESEPSSTSIDGVLKVAVVVGAGFTLYHGWSVVMPYLTNGRKKEAYETPVEQIYVPKRIKELKVKSPPSTPVKNEVKEIDME